MIVLPLLLAALQQLPPPPGAAAPVKRPQLPPLPPAWADTSPFRRLELPTPGLLREGSGRPGPRYWQQRADYTISATLDTATHTIRGRESIRYTNHSPDTLRYLWLQLDQNIYREDSRGHDLNPEDARFSGAGFVGGYVIETADAVRQAGGQAATKTPLRTTINGTMMRVDLDRPLPPAGSATLEIAYRFQVPEHGSDRMGRERFPEGWLYEIAQWYPRLAVYDDVRGWNTEQYLGLGEFYLEYGDIDFAITVPRGFIVAGTGTLQNPLEVLTSAQRARLALAQRSDAPVADSLWRESTRMVRHSIKHYSEKWFPYPYPTAINVNGPVGGMEYPMIVFCANRRSRDGLFGVTTHELGHQWFPMVVGSNERLYAWMDEGFNSFINIYSARAYF